MEAALDGLAFSIHARQGHQSGAADIPQGDLLAALTKAAGVAVNSNLLADYVCDRAGLLVHDGQHVYRFPHRSFQEFLAARALCSRPDFPTAAARLVAADPDCWREVFLLAVRRVAKAPFTQWAVVQEILALPAGEPSPVNYWTAQLCAGLAVDESSLAAALTDATRMHFDSLRHRLAALVSTGQLSATDRARAGVVLGRLGDPRR